MSFGNLAYIERIEAENRRLKATNHELLEILKAVMDEPVPTVRLDGRVYMAQINLGLYEKIKEALAKAEAEDEG